jgi:hypothetical protein
VEPTGAHASTMKAAASESAAAAAGKCIIWN